jgi:hypothetical protein
MTAGLPKSNLKLTSGITVEGAFSEFSDNFHKVSSHFAIRWLVAKKRLQGLSIGGALSSIEIGIFEERPGVLDYEIAAILQV